MAPGMKPIGSVPSIHRRRYVEKKVLPPSAVSQERCLARVELKRPIPAISAKPEEVWRELREVGTVTTIDYEEYSVRACIRKSATNLRASHEKLIISLWTESQATSPKSDARAFP